MFVKYAVFILLLS